MISPYVFLPLISGETPDDEGVGATWNVVDGSGVYTNPGWVTGNAAGNAVWTDDAEVTDIFNFMSGATDGYGGKKLFLSFEIETTATAGTLVLFCLGSMTGTGWMIYLTGDTLQMNKSGSNVKISKVSDISASTKSHVAVLFDAANSELRTWVNGEFSRVPQTDRNNGIALWDDMTPDVGLTILARNNSATTGSRTLASPYDGKMRNVFAADLTDIADPMAYANRNVRALMNSPFKLPTLGGW